MMVINKTYPFYSLFFAVAFLLLTQSNAQSGSNGFLAIKVGTNYFKDNEGRRLTNGSIKGNNRSFINSSTYLNQTTTNSLVFPYCEISYYLERENYFGFNLGLGYQFNKTQYTIKSMQSSFGPNSNNIPNSIRNEGFGVAGFKNHSFKMLFGLNFNTKFGLNIFLQPLNIEFRVIKNDKSNVEYKNYTVYYYQSPSGSSGVYKDSTSALNTIENKSFVFKNYKTNSNFSICFPTTIGVEQTIKIKGFSLIAGVAVSASILEEYIIYRAHIGIPFGKNE